MTRFEPAGVLPEGTAVLQASAGTGKTHAIAALAARYLAEGRVSADRCGEALVEGRELPRAT